MLPTDAKERKDLPIHSGVVKYFPDALAMVARVSKLGNDQHNPGEPLHWSRGKSNDHLDCAMRHLVGAGTLDDDGQMHLAKAAWRILAALQLEYEDRDVVWMETGDIVTADEMSDIIIEKAKEFSYKDLMMMPLAPEQIKFRSATEEEIAKRVIVTNPPRLSTQALDDLCATERAEIMPLGLTGGVPKTVPSFNPVDIGVNILNVETGNPKAYLAGPMSGRDLLNFPMFDEHKGYLEAIGYDVISPADLDRAAGIDEYDYRLGDQSNWPVPDMEPILRRDIEAMLSLKPGKDAIALMPGWEKSTGACAEFFFARWWGLLIIDAVHGIALDAGDVNFTEICTSMMKYLRGQV